MSERQLQRQQGVGDVKKYLFIFVTATLSQPIAAFETTGIGKIDHTQGHVAPNCRIVLHKENGTGVERTFRIQDVQGHDDVNAIALAAMLANRDVTISYDPTVTSGCGTEPRVMFITIY